MYDYAKFMAELERKNPAQPEFIQAAGEIIASVIDTVNSNPLYLIQWQDALHHVLPRGSHKGGNRQRGARRRTGKEIH